MAIGSNLGLSFNNNVSKVKDSLIVKEIKKNTDGSNKLSEIRTVPSKENNTGYIKGYEKLNKNEEKLVANNIDVKTREIGENTYNWNRYQTSSFYDMDNFKYNLEKSKDHDYDDPTFLGFEIYIHDDNADSPFNNNTNNKLLKFLNNYSSISDINKRISIFYEFKNRLFEIFNGTSDYPSKKLSKNYYINSIKGTDLFNKKLIKYTEDKITLTLSEDVSMSALYLSELYNNLIYSYKTNRYMIPEHLLRFDMSIKINDIRTFRYNNPAYKDTQQVDLDNNPYILDKRQSCIIYTLHDCNFLFYNSKNYTDEITVGGFGASVASTPSTLDVDIIFKSVSKQIEPVLKSGSMNLYNKQSILFKENGINDDFYNGMLKDGDDLSNWDKQSLYKYMNEIKIGKSPKTIGSEVKLTSFSNMVNNITGTIAKGAENLTDKIKKDIVRNLKEKRNDLINRFTSQLENATSIRNLRTLRELGNVYEGDSHVDQSVLTKIKRDVLNDVDKTRKEIINAGKSEFTKFILDFDKKINF